MWLDISGIIDVSVDHICGVSDNNVSVTATIDAATNMQAANVQADVSGDVNVSTNGGGDFSGTIFRPAESIESRISETTSRSAERIDSKMRAVKALSDEERINFQFRNATARAAERIGPSVRERRRSIAGTVERSRSTDTRQYSSSGAGERPIPALDLWRHSFEGVDVHEFIRRMMKPSPAVPVEVASPPDVEFVFIDADGGITQRKRSKSGTFRILFCFVDEKVYFVFFRLAEVFRKESTSITEIFTI